ncbi:MAG TPA: hypothetical protein VK277_09245 [Acidimicrobiales bacterium]|nr:hypothetical protein [Acidimicrobiales bacterium]
MRGNPTARPSSPRLVIVALALLLPLTVLPAAVGPAGALDPGKGKPPKCPSGWSCTTIPCGQKKCPVVQIGPDSDVGADQWLYVNLYRLPKGTPVLVDYCSDLTTLPAPPLCFTPTTPPGIPPSSVLSHEPVDIEPFKNGTTSFSLQVAEVGTSDPPLWGQHVVAGGFDPTEDSFFCDGTPANPCSIDVFTTPGVAPSAANTAVIPVNFAPATSGCAGESQVTTESEFGIEQLLPEAARVSCEGANPAVAVNTAVDGVNAVTQAAEGNVDVAFTDDPESPDQQAQIAGHLALIPIALSANVVGTKGIMILGGVGYPQDAWDLTPNMVGGLLPFAFTAFDDADLTPCPPAGCRLPCEAKTGSCSLLMQLNAVPYSKKLPYFDEQSYGTFLRSDPTGVTDQLFQWLCAAPNQPVTVPLTGQTVTESQTGAQQLVDGLQAAGDPSAACPLDTDQLPALQIGSPSQWSADAQPDQQANNLEGASGFVPPPGFADPQLAGFATMNWAESDFYGLYPASLQNATGQFVAPTAASIDAALADATTNADGSYTFNYDDTGDPAAYPLPDVIYAAVPTGTLPPTEATALTDLLTQILDLTGGTDTGDLPPGFVPLPSAVYTQALADVTADIHG